MASGPGTQGRLTRYSASATSECRRNIKDHSNRLKGAREVTGHKLLQKRICSLPEGHTMGNVSKWENLLQYLYFYTCFLQCYLSALIANKAHFALDLRLFLVNLFQISQLLLHLCKFNNKSVTRTLWLTM